MPEFLNTIQTQFSTDWVAVWALGTAGGFLLTYILQVCAERRLKQTANAEMQIKLLTAFAELMSIAHSRKEYHVSDKAIELLIPKINTLDVASANDMQKIQELLRSCIITVPMGLAQAQAPVAGIFTMGKNHRFLRPIAIQALVSLNFDATITKVSEYYLRLLHKGERPPAPVTSTAPAAGVAALPPSPEAVALE